jgi:phosphate transport system permease protein
MRQRLKRFKETFIEGVLLISSTVTSLTVLLIIFFLFSESFGLFKMSPVEEGFTLLTHKDNPVKILKTEDIKQVFDQEITNWNQLGGLNEDIELFRIDDIANYYSEEELGANFEFMPQKIEEYITAHTGVVAFIADKYIKPNVNANKLEVDKIKLTQVLKAKEWFPTAQPAAQLGVMPLIAGTFMVSIGAILLALPFGLAAAIYLAEIADIRVRNFLKPTIELLAGIPSVVYGFFGLVVIVPLIQQMFNLPVGESALAGSIILGIMALPTIITISEDAIRNTPRAMKEASLALGANHWQTIMRVVIPYSISGITAAVILGIGRAIGETMAVLMVTGNAAVMPTSLLQPVRTIPATIAAELGEAPFGGLHFKALFFLGCILFFITLIINFIVEFIAPKKRTEH